MSYGTFWSVKISLFWRFLLVAIIYRGSNLKHLCNRCISQPQSSFIWHSFEMSKFHDYEVSDLLSLRNRRKPRLQKSAIQHFSGGVNFSIFGQYWLFTFSESLYQAIAKQCHVTPFWGAKILEFSRHRLDASSEWQYSAFGKQCHMTPFQKCQTSNTLEGQAWRAYGVAALSDIKTVSTKQCHMTLFWRCYSIWFLVPPTRSITELLHQVT